MTDRTYDDNERIHSDDGSISLPKTPPSVHSRSSPATVGPPQSSQRRSGTYAQTSVHIPNMPQPQAARPDIYPHNCHHISHRLQEEAAVHENERAVDNRRQLYRFKLLILLAVMFIPLGYIIRGISEANAMNILQIIAVFVVEAVRVFPWI
ncbi:hypothetical protein BDD12DRAFT_874152 [Trichophaea hybrida]|nr:hypothetical protein BDD12DRAFT_874152 [Trichophaea hybrida]